jgi:TonB family protein
MMMRGERMPCHAAVALLALLLGDNCLVTIDYGPIVGIADNRGVHPPPPPPIGPLAPPGKVERVRMNGRILEDRLLKKVLPAFPADACRQGLSGTVQLSLTIAGSGRVRDVKALHGERIFAEAAIVALWQWSWRPMLVNGAPVEVVTDISTVFSAPAKGRDVR